MKKYYTTTETAEELNTTIRTVSRWLKTGVIAGMKPGDTWQITAKEIERMRKIRQEHRRRVKKPRDPFMS